MLRTFACFFHPHWYCFFCLLSDYHLKYSLNLFFLFHFDNFQLFHFLLIFSLFYLCVVLFLSVKWKIVKVWVDFWKIIYFYPHFFPRPAYVFVSTILFSLSRFLFLSSHSSLLRKSVKSFLLIIALPPVVKYIEQDRGVKREKKCDRFTVEEATRKCVEKWYELD